MTSPAAPRSNRVRWIAATTAAGLALLALANLELLQAAFEHNPDRGSAASAQRGQVLWQLDCAACHGPHGRGDGPARAGLARQPKDLTRIALPPVFPHGILAYRIAHGGTLMPAWQGVLTQQEIWNLVRFIRALGAEAGR